MGQQDVLANVRKAVEGALQARWAGTYEVLEHKYENISIVVDFDESKLGPRKFSKAVADCVEAAYKAATAAG